MSLTEEEIENYKLVSGFLLGLETAERLDDLKFKASIKRAENETHWIRFLLIKKNDEEDDDSSFKNFNIKMVSYEQNIVPSLFSVFLRKDKYEITVKANINWGHSQSQRNDMAHHFLKLINDQGLHKYKFDLNLVNIRGNFPLTTVKFLVTDLFLDGILKVYESIKYYNEKIHPAILENRTW